MNKLVVSNVTLPTLISSNDISNYIKKVNSFPNLTPEEENDLAVKLIKENDIQAAHKLVTSHLKLVVRIAVSFKNYGISLVDLISEGNIGLMYAVRKFKPELGFRLSTYAMWWIKASMQEYIIKSWSMVKIGTTAAQKKLFFNFKKVKHKLNILGTSKSLSNEEISQIAKELEISNEEVAIMDSRLSQSDVSLNELMDNSDGNSDEAIDFLPCHAASPEEVCVTNQENKYQKDLFNQAVSTLNEREKEILSNRILSEQPDTLEDLANKFSISKERVRQIEKRVIEKLREYVSKFAAI